MFKVELSYYVGKNQDKLFDLDQDSVKKLWIKYTIEELKKTNRAKVTIDEVFSAADKAFDKFISLIKAESTRYRK